MSETMALELIRAVPAALWVIFALIVFLALRRVIRDRLTNLSAVRASGVEMSFAVPLLEAAQHDQPDTESGTAQDTPEPAGGYVDLAPSPSERRGGAARLAYSANCLKGGRILWVDDHPNRNLSLAKLFELAGMNVDTVSSTSAALKRLEAGSYDVIITDMYRREEGPSTKAAFKLVEQLARLDTRIPVLVYTDRRSHRDGVPDGVFGYTSNGDNLVQYIIDVMERHHFGIGMRVPTLLQRR